MFSGVSWLQRSRGGFCGTLRTIVAWNSAKSDVEPIPAVDRDDSDCHIHQLLFAELGPGLIMDFVRHMALGHGGMTTYYNPYFLFQENGRGGKIRADEGFY